MKSQILSQLSRTDSGVMGDTRLSRHTTPAVLSHRTVMEEVRQVLLWAMCKKSCSLFHGMISPHVEYGANIPVSDTASLMTFLACGQNMRQVKNCMQKRGMHCTFLYLVEVQCSHFCIYNTDGSLVVKI